MVTDPEPQQHHCDGQLSFWHDSPLGIARCESCKTAWPCHLTAWGGFNRISTCNICRGTVVFTIPPIPNVTLDPGYMEKGDK